MPMGNN